jgi:hypothetical protein
MVLWAGMDSFVHIGVPEHEINTDAVIRETYFQTILSEIKRWSATSSQPPQNPSFPSRQSTTGVFEIDKFSEPEIDKLYSRKQ